MFLPKLSALVISQQNGREEVKPNSVFYFDKMTFHFNFPVFRSFQLKTSYSSLPPLTSIGNNPNSPPFHLSVVAVLEITLIILRIYCLFIFLISSSAFSESRLWFINATKLYSRNLAIIPIRVPIHWFRWHRVSEARIKFHSAEVKYSFEF